MNFSNDLLENINKLHTTELGIIRIRKNLDLDTNDVVRWCKNKITDSNALIIKKGKNNIWLILVFVFYNLLPIGIYFFTDDIFPAKKP